MMRWLSTVVVVLLLAGCTEDPPTRREEYLRVVAELDARAHYGDAKLVEIGKSICTIARNSHDYNEFWGYLDDGAVTPPPTRKAELVVEAWEIAALQWLCPRQSARLDANTPI